MHLSASKYNTYNLCPLKFKYQYIDNIPTEKKTYFEFGTIVHNVIEQLQKMIIRGNIITYDDSNDILESCWLDDIFGVTSMEYKKSAQIMLNTFIDWQYNNPNKVKAVEEWCKFKIADYTVLGKIDRIEETPEGQIHLVDFKTGNDYITSNTINQDIQMNIYAIGIKTNLGKNPIKASLFYLKAGKIVSYIINQHDSDIFNNRIFKMTKLIHTKQFDPTPGNHCNFCDFVNICPKTSI